MAADPADAGLYPGKDGPTGGWSGSSTSRERDRYEETFGVRRSRQRQVYEMLRAAGRLGLTDREVQASLDIGHGASSGALTRLHREGLIVRLAERRQRNEIYVLPQFVRDRPTVPYRPNRASSIRGLEEAAAYTEAAAERADEAFRRLGPAAGENRSSYLRGKRDALVVLAGELRLKAVQAAEASDRGRRAEQHP